MGCIVPSDPSSLKPWVVSFVSQKGGVGKSTLARALATYAAKGGAVVKMVDNDPQQSSTTDWNATRRGLGKGNSFDVSEALTSSDVSQHLTGAALIIVDTPGRASQATKAIAKLSHLVVQPTGGSRDDMLPAIKVFNELLEDGIPHDRLVFALSRTDSEAEEKAVRAYLESLNFTVLAGSLQNRAGYKAAQNNGLSVLETNFESLNDRAAEIVAAIADRVFAIHDAKHQMKSDAGAGRESKRLQSSKDKDAA